MNPTVSPGLTRGGLKGAPCARTALTTADTTIKTRTTFRGSIRKNKRKLKQKLSEDNTYLVSSIPRNDLKDCSDIAPKLCAKECPSWGGMPLCAKVAVRYGHFMNCRTRDQISWMGLCQTDQRVYSCLQAEITVKEDTVMKVGSDGGRTVRLLELVICYCGAQQQTQIFHIFVSKTTKSIYVLNLEVASSMVIAGVEPGEFFAGALFCILQTWISRTNDFNSLRRKSINVGSGGKKEERSAAWGRGIYPMRDSLHDNLIGLCEDL